MTIRDLSWYMCDHNEYFKTESWLLYNISRQFSGNGNWQNDSRDQEIKMCHGFQIEDRMMDDFSFLIRTPSIYILYMILAITFLFQTLGAFDFQLIIFLSISTSWHFWNWKISIVFLLHSWFSTSSMIGYTYTHLLCVCIQSCLGTPWGTMLPSILDILLLPVRVYIFWWMS